MVIGVVLQSTAAIFGSVLILITIIRNGGTSSLEFDRAGLFWSCTYGWSCCGLGRNSELLHLRHGCQCDTEYPDHHCRLHSHWHCSRIAHARRNNHVVRLAGHILFGQWHLARCNRSWPKFIYNEDGESDAVLLLLLETYFRKSSTFSDPAY